MSPTLMHPPTPPQETVAAGRGKQREGILVFRNLFDRTIETQLPHRVPCFSARPCQKSFENIRALRYPP